MAAYYVKSGSGVTDYSAAHTYASGSPGDRMVPAPSDGTSNVAIAKKAVWECTTGGTTNGAITWPAAVTYDSTTITQNGVVFTARQPGYSTVGTPVWTFATPYCGYAALAANAINDDVYISNNHAENQGQSISISNAAAGVRFVCVSDVAAPPTATATTATISTTGAFSITITGSSGNSGVYWYGVTFSAGLTSSSALNLTVGGVLSGYLYEQCTFYLATSSAGGSFNLGQGIFINCNLKFGGAGQSCALSRMWYGGALLAGGVSPTAVFTVQSNFGRVDGFDLTQASAGVNIFSGTNTNGEGRARNIKVPASWSGAVAGTVVSPAFNVAYDLFNGDNTGTNYLVQRRARFGQLNSESTIVRTGGGSDGVTPVSWKIVTTSDAGCFPSYCFPTSEGAIWNNATGIPVTVTAECITDGVTLTNAQAWMEVTYLGSAGSPLSTFVSSAPAGILTTPTNLTTSTATWTTSGLGSPVTQKMSVTFTPQLKGYIYVTFKICRATTTVYIDPTLTITGQATGAQKQLGWGPFINEPAGFPASRGFMGA